ncbi:hypothetical protein [Sulfurisphaera ohwakuensis]|uniref:hypothetical protein n=1 Tax=Sulfurisphaera ohwakuensis TaxID=69656 RepID=UPI0036F27684
MSLGYKFLYYLWTESPYLGKIWPCPSCGSHHIVKCGWIGRSMRIVVSVFYVILLIISKRVSFENVF